MMETTTQNHLTETAEIGDILSNRYRVLQVIKSGAVTQVYLTEDISLLHDNVCLLKRYQYHSKQAHLFKLNKKLFETELNYLRLLTDCDKIPRLLDNFEDEYSLSLIEELIEGDLVSQLIPSEINAPNCWLELNVLEFLRDILDVLSYLNSKDLIHGDLKPTNIIQRKQDNHFCLIDFASIQKISELENPFKNLLHFNSSHHFSPSHYLAPEQISGHIKANSDLYALGIMAIQVLTGIDPNQLELSPKIKQLNWLEIWRSHHRTEDFLISEELLPILNKLTAYEVKNRYLTPQDALTDVNNLIEKKTAQIIIFTEEQWPGLGFSPSYYFSEFIDKETETNESLEENTGEIINLDQENFALNIDDTLDTENAPSTQELLAILEGNVSEFEDDQENPEVSENNVKSKQAESNALKIDHKWLLIIGGIGLTGLLIYASVIYFSLGSILNILGLDSSGKQLLKAQEIYDAGNIKEAISLAESIPSDSKVYQESKTIIKEWQNELEKTEQQLQQIEVAFAQKQWETVIQDAKKIPSNPIWQDQVKPLVTKAKENLDIESRKLLQQAINHAEAQEFGEALFYLKQIPLESSFGELVKNKLVEYEEKRNIRDYYNLQQAFNAAQKQDFLIAINFLQKVDPRSEKGAIAQQKIIEYTKMQNIKQIMQQRQGNYTPISYSFNPGSVLSEI